MESLFSAFSGKEYTTERDEEKLSSQPSQSSKKKELPIVQQSADTLANKRPIENDTSESKPGEKKSRIDYDNEANISSHVPEQQAPVIKKQPAKVYPFELDEFQKESIRHIENNQSVLVSAHTSAGKTAVAEYAIAMALREKQRVIYTSPIKALSNQKYRDLAEEFSDVGLMTGDVTLNPNASCLVMTTEILRSMLYRGSEIIREVAWAIFDEVHYMRDRERGVVWEESIILLPHKVRYVFLSATIPNAKQFASWITKIHHQPCHVVYTEYRPTPLQHYMFPLGGQGVFLIVDEKGRFRDENMQRAMSQLVRTSLEEEVLDGSGGSKDAKKKKALRKQDKKADIAKLINMVIERKYDPVIVFSFSKKDCENYAKRLSRFTLNNEEEQELVGQIFANAIESLNDDDKNLPQIVNVLPFLKRGIGIHHGGLLPILKEIVEILFGEGLLKVLFATETFAMGINMPAKTVIFTAVRKYDGADFRYLGSGEYIQMSGRAGRRGLDERGIVIQMVEEAMEPDTAKSIMSGQADPLTSTFHLGYNMLLNLLRVEDADPEFIIRNSLFAYQQEQALPNLEKKIESLNQDLEQIVIDSAVEADFIRYHELISQMEKVRFQLKEKIYQPKYALGFMRAGRLVRVIHPDNPSWWGVVTSYRVAEKTEVKAGVSITSDVTVIDVVLACDSRDGDRPATFLESGRFDLENSKIRSIPCKLEDIDGISTICIHIPKNFRSDNGREAILLSVNEILSRFKDGIPLLDPIEDMNIKDADMPKLLNQAEKLQSRLKQDKIQLMEPKRREDLYQKFLSKHEMRMEIKALEKEKRMMQTLPLKDKLKRMKVVLRTLGHVDKDNVIQLKGRVACEISTANELLTTELILSGTFNDVEPEVAAAMGEEDIKLPPELDGPYKKLQSIARRIAEIEQDAKLEVDPDEFVKTFRPDLMEPVYRWCKGSKFSEICSITTCFEGTIIRSVRRLVELLRQLCIAAKVIGDIALEDMFKKAISQIKRDIIFAGSLYL